MTKENNKSRVVVIDTVALNDTGVRKYEVSRYNNNEIVKIFIGGAKVTSRVAFWVVKQVTSLMVEGVKGVASGVSESSSYYKPNKTSRVYRGTTPKYVDNRSYTIVMPLEKKKKPIWYIPTKEEELMDNIEG